MEVIVSSSVSATSSNGFCAELRRNKSQILLILRKRVTASRAWRSTLEIDGKVKGPVHQMACEEQEQVKEGLQIEK